LQLRLSQHHYLAESHPHLLQILRNAHINAHRAIVDALRAANAKALADFQAALATVTTDAELKAAKDARKAAVTAALATAKAAKAALVKPTKPAKAPKA
jgi:hypothetical protein